MSNSGNETGSIPSNSQQSNSQQSNSQPDTLQQLQAQLAAKQQQVRDLTRTVEEMRRSTHSESSHQPAQPEPALPASQSASVQLASQPTPRPATAPAQKYRRTSTGILLTPRNLLLAFRTWVERMEGGEYNPAIMASLAKKWTDDCVNEVRSYQNGILKPEFDDVWRRYQALIKKQQPKVAATSSSKPTSQDKGKAKATPASDSRPRGSRQVFGVYELEATEVEPNA